MRIVPIKTGTIRCNKTVLTYGKGYGEEVSIPSIAWFVESENNKMLVDTGMCSTQRAQTYHYPGSRQEEGQRIDQALRGIGVGAEEIDTVILTHLHWDHCANLDRFVNAEFYVQRAELEYARRPSPPYYRSYESPQSGLTPSYQDVDFRLLDGDAEIVPGVEVLLTPGHSMGHQSVLVHGADCRFVIAGDACLCNENLSPNPAKGLDYTMIGRYMDANAAWKSLERVARVADVVLPGHEEEVFAQESYS